MYIDYGVGYWKANTSLLLFFEEKFEHCILHHYDIPFFSCCYRNLCDSNEQHVIEFDSTREAAEEAVKRNSEDIIKSIDGKFLKICLVCSDFGSSLLSFLKKNKR